ncbi:MAG: hypothetical protein ACXVH7_14255, partial [Thermoanaerobaculia bacterium]
MSDEILARILRESGVPGLVEVLAERLSPTDLQSLLLEVMRMRAGQRDPSAVLQQYESNRFVAPSIVPQDVFTLCDRIAFHTAAATSFTPIEFSPVGPLGCSSAIAPIAQNTTVATIRGTEVVSDPGRDDGRRPATAARGRSGGHARGARPGQGPAWRLRHPS